MKPEIHPEYVETTIHCACGAEVTTRATVPNLRVDICSNCHPFYTGKQRLVDTAGMVERFRRRYNIKVDEEDSSSTEEDPPSAEESQTLEESVEKASATEA